jgi:hypothetical protein
MIAFIESFNSSQLTQLEFQYFETDLELAMSDFCAAICAALRAAATAASILSRCFDDLTTGGKIANRRLPEVTKTLFRYFPSSRHPPGFSGPPLNVVI